MFLMKPSLGIAAQRIEHELERLQARLVGLGHLRGIYAVERRAQHVHVAVDLVVRGIGEDHERNLRGHLGKARRHVGMRTPGRHGVIVALGLVVEILEVPLLAQPADRVLQYLLVRLPVAQHLVETVGREIGDELLHAIGRHAIGEHLAGHLPHAETRERAVAVEGDVLGTESHGLGFLRFSRGSAGHRPGRAARCLRALCDVFITN